MLAGARVYPGVPWALHKQHTEIPCVIGRPNLQPWNQRSSHVKIVKSLKCEGQDQSKSNPVQCDVMSSEFQKEFQYQNISKHQSLTIHHPSPDKVAGSCWVPNEPLPAAAGRTTKCFCSVGLGVPLKGSSSNDQAQENHQDIAVQIWDATTGNDSRNLESNRKGLLLHWGKFRESSLFTHVP